MRKAIPVSSNLETRGLPAFSCSRCDGREDDMHLFSHCPIARQVWELAPLIAQPLTTVTSMAELIATLPPLTVLPPTGLSTPFWPWTLWNLWKSRNKLCFENRVFSAMEIIINSISDAKEWQAAQLTSPTQTCNQQQRPSAMHKQPPTTSAAYRNLSC